MATVEEADARFSELGWDESVIPPGPYCYRTVSGWKQHEDGLPYFETAPCPYWAVDRNRPHQENGYCAFLREGDWNDPTGFSLLWDQVKSCGIKRDDDPESEDHLSA
jgi:hypothetical protein